MKLPLSKTAAAAKRTTKMVAQTVDICPNCNEEIGEKSTSYVRDDKSGEPVWRHNKCGGEFESSDEAKARAAEFKRDFLGKGEKTAGVLRKGPDGYHLDFLKTLMKERKWKKDPSGLASHPAKHRLMYDKADVKAASGVNPLVRASVNEGSPRGDDAQIPLTVNPYSTGTAGDPAQATQYENGYQFAQSLGHLGLNSATPDQMGAWAARDPAWRDGFGSAADGLGCVQVSDQMDSTPKTACWALEYFAMTESRGK